MTKETIDLLLKQCDRIRAIRMSKQRESKCHCFECVMNEEEHYLLEEEKKLVLG
ncbi:MAG: hypothetical protein ACD_5C00075G0015 [uncultured bacterium]|nr:MAG: hypothetical protein ACD_5C00075G0015 [uncultured bacterium]